MFLPSMSVVSYTARIKTMPASARALFETERTIKAKQGKPHMANTDDTNDQYLQPTEILDSEHPDIVSFVTETIDSAVDPVERACRLFLAVRDRIIYDTKVPFYKPEHYRASHVLKQGRGYCVSKACLLCAAGRTAGIPSRLGLVDLRNRGANPEIIEIIGCDIFTFHGYTEFLLEGKWLKATPAFDSSVFAKHNIAPVTFDGIHDAVYPSHNLNGAPYAEYLTYHGSFADLPLDALLKSWRKIYGADRVQMWIDAFEAGEIIN